MAVEKEPLGAVPATGVETFWLKRVEKSALVRVLKFWPERGIGTEFPPVVLDWRALINAIRPAVSLKLANTGSNCWMSFCSEANPVLRLVGTTFVLLSTVPKTFSKPGETGLRLGAPGVSEELVAN